jgi:hypothetical protein
MSGRWFEPAAVDVCLLLFREKGFKIRERTLK